MSVGGSSLAFMSPSGLGLPAIFLVVAGYLGCNTVAAVATVAMAVGFAGIAMSGWGVNHLDLAPPFAGE